jgi:dipeptidyl-peptidase-4
VRANDLYVERLDDGRITRLTRDGSATTINGTSDWVYEEELGVRDAFRWSPDGRAIAYWQFDSSRVETFTLINDTDSLYPTLTRIPYPKAGTTNSAVRIGVVAATGGATTWMRVPGDPREHYLTRLSWIDSGSLAIQQLTRLQNRHDLWHADARSGEARLVFRDQSTTWIDADEQVRWIDGGRAFLWVSERDGWRHVYRVSAGGGQPTLLTSFDADIISVAGIDEAGGWLYFTA